jgi:hypothetical protein
MRVAVETLGAAVPLIPAVSVSCEATLLPFTIAVFIKAAEGARVRACVRVCVCVCQCA